MQKCRAYCLTAAHVRLAELSEYSSQAAQARRYRKAASVLRTPLEGNTLPIAFRYPVAFKGLVVSENALKLTHAVTWDEIRNALQPWVRILHF